MIDPDFAPHLDALRRCGERGFQFIQLPDALCGFRDRAGAMDVLLVRDVTDARAARYRRDDLDRHAQPPGLWGVEGTVAEVVVDLLALPPHGWPGAPALAATSTDLWLPGSLTS